MVTFPFLAVSFIMNVVAVLFFLCCLALILLILIQKGRGGGLSGAFGGAGGASSILGSKTGDFLTWVTIILVGFFLLLAVVMGRFYRPGIEFGDETSTQQGQPPEGASTHGPEGASTLRDANAAEGRGEPGS